jgi:hypothetical protein
MVKPAVLMSLFLVLSGIRNATADLVTHVAVNQSGTNFTYTVFNDESSGSPNHISVFHLNVNAPITITGTPPGWDFTTDYATFVGWFNTDIEHPYPDDIPPQGSTIFTISSNVTTTELVRYTVGSWNHATDFGGPSYRSLILSPSFQAIPEPSGILFFAMASIIGLAGLKWAARNKADVPVRA